MSNDSIYISKRFYKNSFLFLSLGLLAVIIGFSQSVTSRFSTFTWVYHVHGISATLWMILLIIQPLTYRFDKLKAHRIIGWTSLILVPVIVVAGSIMMKNMILNQDNYPPQTVYKLAFIDATTLVAFIGFYSLGIYYRKKLKLHARFMVCTIFAPLIPALTRVFFVLNLAGGFNSALTYSYLVIELAILIILFRERKATEIKFTYLPALIFIIVQHLLMYDANNWDWWIHFMDYYAGTNV
ncbi:hypothetical protein OO013_15605 [Mangrovivirga sp. M17]|uniref:Histidine kinase N-terminal 7TM region domain-containing protein n=1 Tax=Mangrovivirga halotolerans TaxID=2993936 RepID=A0ABT3RVC2_9BACT|nr:hypothetical protein [Mangrovivirga halotolerans]MCX2745303.1 hypothetical protein [Mangrovivirga halotolerans]